MNISALSNSLSTYQVASNFKFDSASSTQTTSSSMPQDGPPEVSELGSYMKQLKDLQVSDPTKFKELASQIAQKLQDAADTATKSGDTNQASALSDLADKFKTAAQDGKLPDLTPPHGGPMGPPPGPPPSSDSTSTSATSDSTTSTDGTTTDSTSSSTTLSSADLSKLKQLLAMFTPNTGTDPLSTLTGVLGSVLSAQQS